MSHLMLLAAASHGGISQLVAVNQQVSNPVEPHRAKVPPASNGLDISQPDHPLYHFIVASADAVGA